MTSLRLLCTGNHKSLSSIVIVCGNDLRENGVFWIYASDTGRFEQNTREALDWLKTPGRNYPKANTFELFHAWLEDQRTGPWLLVLDNADEATYLLQPLAKDTDRTSAGRGNARTETIYDYLPISSPGTRHRDMAEDLVDAADILTIEPMGEQSALNLLQNKLGPQSDHEIAK
ncbi:hypothetical protein E4T42_07229 [Aureobasidium subglaciale]|nr:hypothetical protein E4T42_07229 [Aureobasidium subglaciale]